MSAATDLRNTLGCLLQAHEYAGNMLCQCGHGGDDYATTDGVVVTVDEAGHLADVMIQWATRARSVGRLAAAQQMLAEVEAA